MKIRISFVSNSSSSSFIIYNWSQVPEEKKQKILNYKKSVLEEWQKLGVKFKEHQDNSFGIRPIYSDFGKDASSDGICMDSQYDFGFVGGICDWKFRERKENGILEMATMMDNFEMDKWMDYLGGFDYRWTGDVCSFVNEESK